MSSIIDEIAKAEAQAATIRQDAAASARDMIASAQAAGEKALAAQVEAGRTAQRTAAQRAEEEGALISEKVLATRRAEAAQKCAAAKEKLPEAVSYLLRRVVSSE